MKRFLTALVLLIWSFGCFATEPTTTTWVGDLSVTQIFTGDYNTAQGRIMFSCNGDNQTLYWFDLDRAAGRVMYTHLITAFTMGKRISIMKNTVPSYTNEFQCFRIVIY